jgi:hypothetical protein
MTKRAVLIVDTGPAEGREDEWRKFYDEVHIPEILERVPGFVAATRYKRPAGAEVGPDDHGYCTVYEIEADDPGACFSALTAAVQSGKLTRSEATSGRAKLTLWEETTPRAVKH